MTSCRDHRRWPAAESESPLRRESVVWRVDRDDTCGKCERRSEPPKPAPFESFTIDLTCWSQVAAHARDLSSHTGGEVSASWQNRGERCVWTMESKCLSAFRGAIVRPVTFPRGPPSSQACPRPSVGADLGWNRPAIWGISVEELFHDARHPHSQNRQTRRFLSRPRDRRFCWRETRRPLIWRAFFSCYRHWISIRVKLR